MFTGQNFVIIYRVGKGTIFQEFFIYLYINEGKPHQWLIAFILGLDGNQHCHLDCHINKILTLLQ